MSLARRVLAFLVRPMEDDIIPLEHGRPVRRMIARAIWADRRENRGVRIVRKYSRDLVVEYRERRLNRPWVRRRAEWLHARRYAAKPHFTIVRSIPRETYAEDLDRVV